MSPARCISVLAVVVAASAFAPSPTSAEDDSNASVSDGTTAYLQAGFSTARPHMSGTAGGASLVCQLGRRLALEGSATYSDRGAGAAATTVSVNGVLQLAARSDKAVPYITAGAGLYRASFDTSDTRFAGPAPSGEMRTGRYRHLMQASATGWDLGQLPPFYGKRLAASIARDGRNGVESFTDPALGVGAGVRIRLGRAWAMRQDARALVVLSDGRSYTVGTFTVQLGR